MKIIKSGLQNKLEEEGWEPWINIDPLDRWHKGKSDEDLRKQYSTNLEGLIEIKDVLITEAHDIYGKPLPDLKGVYIKRGKTTISGYIQKEKGVNHVIYDTLERIKSIIG